MPRVETIKQRCRFGVAWILLAAAGFEVTSLPGADPPHYVRRATWQETLLASLEAIARQGIEEGLETFESGTVRGGEPPRRVSVEVSGASELCLFVTGCPDVIWGVGTWADAKLVSKDGAETSLNVLESLDVLEGQYSIDFNLRSGLYQELEIGGKKFDRGINVLADSAIRVPLQRKYERFEAWIGIDDWAGRNGNVRFTVAGPRASARKRLRGLLFRDFPEELPRKQMRWEEEDRIFEKEWTPGHHEDLARRYANACGRVPPLADKAEKAAISVRGPEGLEEIRQMYYRSRALDSAIASLKAFPFEAVRLAIEDLTRSFPETYLRGPEHLEKLSRLESAAAEALARIQDGKLPDHEDASSALAVLEALRREALLANPLLSFDRLLLIRRKPVGEPRRSTWADRGFGEYLWLPRQSSWHLGTVPNPLDWDNEIAVLSPVNPEGKIATLYKPEGRRLVTDVDLHFDADRLLFSMPDKQGRWQVCEVGAGGAGFRQLTPGDQPDVHCYDACYLPSGKIVFLSTAVLQGVPCNAGVIVGMMYRMDRDGRNIEQICFEQDHDYCPSVLNDGRVLYLRWDYTDTPHVWNRVLMSMNPDGTAQMEYYGSNSYWPNAVFFARAIPEHPTKVVGIVTGHHEGRVGELVIFDPGKGRREAEGVVQRIPGRGKTVEPLIEDKLTEHSWPKFLHPYPLSEKYFLVSAKPRPDSLWGIYLVDVFDNMVLVKEEERRVLLEPIPLRGTRRPPAIAEKPRSGQRDAIINLVDAYSGPGLRGVPRGAVKSLRVFTYHFGYQRLAGIDHRVGSDGPWEVKRVLGTVPVEEDGSALFRAPAKMPLSLQPLDAEGKAIALMRSWLTAMPGETLSCAGCHEGQATSAQNKRTLAYLREPSEIAPWRGTPRGFSFPRDVQPVLDKHCVSCHDGRKQAGGGEMPDLRADQGGFVVYEHGNPDLEFVRGARREDLVGKRAGVFDPSYVALREYVRTGGLESDLHPLPPYEFHADTSELLQMLRKGHHGVELDPEAWDRLVTWIDLNAPCHGSWSEVTRIPGNQRDRRVALRRLYGGIAEDWEEIPVPPSAPSARVESLAPAAPTVRPAAPAASADGEGWPFDAAEASRRQQALEPHARTVDLGGGATMEFVRIPAGSFIMGDPRGDADEQPPHPIEILRPFWIGKHEVTNEQYSRFDPSHDSRFEHRTSWIFSEAYLGWPLNRPRQPVVRVSWEESMKFCAWLSEKAGVKAALPTEAQWEYACRAGTGTPLSYGGLDSDFSRCANMADSTLRGLAQEGWRPKAPDLVPRDDRWNDAALVTADVGSYAPNAWGLHDMHGNAAEWTRSSYVSYPCRGDGPALPGSPPAPGRKVVRGGSWRDRPPRCRSAFRLGYLPGQKVFNVGFRVVFEEPPELVGRREPRGSLDDCQAP